jgi:azurin
LRHPSSGVRRAAIEVLPKTEESYKAMVEARNFRDEDLRVRLAAVLALTDIQPSPSMGELLVDMAGEEENITDTWLRHALIIASNLNSESFQAAFRSRGLDSNPPLIEASLPQRLAFGPRLNATTLKRTFGRQQSDETPEVAGKEILISGEIERSNRFNTPGQPPPPISGMVVAQGNKTNGYGIYMLEGKLYYKLNQNGKSYQLVTNDPLPAKFFFKAGLQKDGAMRLFIDNKEIGSVKTAGLFRKELDVPLRVGIDRRKGNDRITSYPDTIFFLRAGLANAKLETLGDNTTPGFDENKKVDQIINLNVVKDVMKFDKAMITAKVGTTIQIVLRNPDFMQHNLVLIKPNTLEKVGAAADQLAQDSNGAKMSYVPKMPEVLAATPLINPGDKYELTITLPAEAGDYPFVCTFPGHWRMMNGILRVTK